MDPNDAKKAIRNGADGIWVSNHGRFLSQIFLLLEMSSLIRK